MIVRRMEEKDIPQVVAIEESTFHDPWSAQSFLCESKRESNIYIVVEDRGSVVGYCGLWGVVGEGQITNVAIREDCRNQGIGKRMLTELIRLGRELELESFTLEVRESNERAIHLYESLGFRSVGTRKDFYTHPNENAIIMWL